jgi:hypothetical protein
MTRTHSFAAVIVASSFALAFALATPPVAAAQPLPPPEVLQSWIQDFKASERGPFELIRWFCHDGRILPARSGCGGEDQGVQHGDWNERSRQLRSHEFAVANVLVALEPQRFVGPNADLETWKQILLERFLVGFDEGWIFRGAFGTPRPTRTSGRGRRARRR